MIADDRPAGGRRKDCGDAGSPVMFRCRLCDYRTDKVTVMRHHVMVHLNYHPYVCPYCDLAHSVKSFPITKHVRVKHPGEVERFECARSEEMERKVRTGYCKVGTDEKDESPDKVTAVVPTSTAGMICSLPPVEPVTLVVAPLTSIPRSSSSSLDRPAPRKRVPSKRLVYRCTFCGLATHIRTDMRHHLMREMHYKPFRCGYCPYTEPSRSCMGKHFRSKHCGMVIDIHDESDPARDATVERMLETECIIRAGADGKLPAIPIGAAAITRHPEPFKTLSRKVPPLSGSSFICPSLPCT